jgi:hypothetical protein
MRARTRRTAGIVIAAIIALGLVLVFVAPLISR